MTIRQEQFEKSAAGRAARAQMQAAAKQSATPNKGEPVLKVRSLQTLVSQNSSYCLCWLFLIWI